jgi:hypothetical protein
VDQLLSNGELADDLFHRRAAMTGHAVVTEASVKVGNRRTVSGATTGRKAALTRENTAL